MVLRKNALSSMHSFARNTPRVPPNVLKHVMHAAAAAAAVKPPVRTHQVGSSYLMVLRRNALSSMRSFARNTLRVPQNVLKHVMHAAAAAVKPPVRTRQVGSSYPMALRRNALSSMHSFVINTPRVPPNVLKHVMHAAAAAVKPPVRTHQVGSSYLMVLRRNALSSMHSFARNTQKVPPNVLKHAMHVEVQHLLLLLLLPLYVKTHLVGFPSIVEARRSVPK
jgi:molybdopterin-guanine dinucleotide biosynthesis protein A